MVEAGVPVGDSHETCMQSTKASCYCGIKQRICRIEPKQAGNDESPPRKEMYTRD